MSDIVERLRAAKRIAAGWKSYEPNPLCQEAATEIERLTDLAKLQGQEIGITRDRDEALEDAMRSFIDILEGAQSGFIPGCGSDIAWKEGRDHRIAEARGLLDAVGAGPKT